MQNGGSVNQNRSYRLALAMLAFVGLFGCHADTSGLATLEVAEAARLASVDGTVFCDANNAKTRAKFGTIPGAVLLTSYDSYDTSAELPAGSKLVFYCHSEMCGAAADAARRAVAAGHSDVAVMPPGIKGWAGAGKPVEQRVSS
jgi:rhodanese-related sulfurtransferase